MSLLRKRKEKKSAWKGLILPYHAASYEQFPAVKSQHFLWLTRWKKRGPLSFSVKVSI